MRYALRSAPLDAIPDLSDVQVIVFAEWPGRSPDLVEAQVTYPISTTLLAAPGVRSVRGQTFFGLSFVYAIFADGTDLYWARSRVLEYLSGVQAKLPDGVLPVLGPDATGVGWVYEYALVDRSGQLDLVRAARAPGLEPALRARERSGRGRGRLGRRLRAPVPGAGGPEPAAVARKCRSAT